MLNVPGTEITAGHRFPAAPELGRQPLMISFDKVVAWWSVTWQVSVSSSRISRRAVSGHHHRAQAALQRRSTNRRMIHLSERPTLPAESR